MNLEKLFKPEKVAVVGASRDDGKTGHEVFENLLHGFEGKVVPVNPNAEEVDGEEALDEIPQGMDLAVVVVPGKIVPNVIDDCAEKDVEAVIVISAGFSETGKEDLEKQIVEKAEENGIALLGPNVLGLINTENSMNASFASKMPESGSISFMSQSGAFCTAILDYAKAEHIGFRHFVSLGNKAMINEVDLLQKWREDDTETILSYTEGIDNGREFIEEAKKTSEEKPIVVVKSGRTEQGGGAASSHTGSIAGSYEAYKAAFRKAGIIEAESNRELLDLGRSFNYQPLPEGGKVAIITNAGGPGVIATDEISENGLELAEFTGDTKREMRDFLPEEAKAHNPLDVIGDAGHTLYRKALESALKDEEVDAALVLLTPQANTEIKKTAKTVIKADQESDKPVFACFMGEQDVMKGKRMLEENQVPEFEDPKDAVKALKAMKKYKEFLEKEETSLDLEYDLDKAETALKDYSSYEDAEKLFEAHGFDIALTEVAETPFEGVEAAQGVGFPVVLKVDSPDIDHKTDVGGVVTGVESKQDVKDGFREIMNNVHVNSSGSEIRGIQVQEELDGLEVALGMKRDPQFGPMIMVGLGGIYIEALNDVSFGIPPFAEEEAERMIEELESSELFEGVRGEKHDLEPVKEAIVRLGDLSLEHEEIKEIDLNPAILRKGKLYISDIVLDIE
ncbi:MAG: acetate--CoA ligase family protein [Nanohaloarchaea archaeon]|nr:acetate--CoA ligase family protein [Candidatus Nanohaloarchaea archaeon]